MAKKKEKAKSPHIIATGKRKTAIAKATIKQGNGTIKINKRPISLLDPYHQLLIKEPLEIAKAVIGDKVNSYDIFVNVKGGGRESQIQASRLAIAKALVEATKSKELLKAYLDYDKAMIVADVRRKETRKPRDSKARAKRQKSYR